MRHCLVIKGFAMWGGVTVRNPGWQERLRALKNAALEKGSQRLLAATNKLE